MNRFRIRIIAYIIYGGFYYWLGYLTLGQENIPGFWKAIMHGFFWLSRDITGLWTEYSSYIQPHASGYGFGYAVGMLLTIPVTKIYHQIALIIGSWFS